MYSPYKTALISLDIVCIVFWKILCYNNYCKKIATLYGGIKDTVFSKMPKTVYDLLHDRDFWLTTYNNSSNDTKYKFSQLISTGKNKLNDENWKNLGIINDTLKNDNIIYSMGEAVSEGILFNNPAFEQFCLLVFNTKSNKILNRT